MSIFFFCVQNSTYVRSYRVTNGKALEILRLNSRCVQKSTVCTEILFEKISIFFSEKVFVYLFDVFLFNWSNEFSPNDTKIKTNDVNHQEEKFNSTNHFFRFVFRTISISGEISVSSSVCLNSTVVGVTFCIFISISTGPVGR